MKAMVLSVVILLTLVLFSCSEKTTQPYSDTVATPYFALESGVYLDSQQYSIYCATQGVTIRYTTDGTNPNEHSTVYTEPFTINTSSPVKAKAYKRKCNPSAIASAYYEVYHSGFHDFVDITRMEATPDTVFACAGMNTSLIKVTVKDGEQFGIPGQQVLFQASMGNIVASSITNEYGIAEALFTAENETGVAKILAKVRNYHPEHPNLLISTDADSLLIHIQDTPLQDTPPAIPDVKTIEYVQQGQIDLNVINTGGVESAILKVRLRDENGNLFTEPRNVWFKIDNSLSPAGVNLDNHNVTDSVLAVSVNGSAQVIFNSGTGNGKASVKASCTAQGHNITTNKSNIVIHAGPPHRIVPFAGGSNTGESVYGGRWKIVAGAYIYDIYDNPVDYGVSVWFYLPDDTYNCQIGAAAYVGNESATGDSTAGVAYTTLTYSGYYTFESLKIRAVTGGINGQEVCGEAIVILPINQPQLELEIIPGSLVFHGNTNTVPPSAVANLNVSVFDGQGCPIHNARIILTSTHGKFEPVYGTNRDPLNCNPYAQPNMVVTDWYNPNAVYDHYYDAFWQMPGGPDISDGMEGLAQGSIRFFEWEIPLGDPLTGKSGERSPGVTTATINCRLLGTDVTGSTSITLIRYPT